MNNVKSMVLLEIKDSKIGNVFSTLILIWSVFNQVEYDLKSFAREKHLHVIKKRVWQK